MNTFAKATDLLTKNETAVVVFTHGDFFRRDVKGSGETGIWVLDPEMVEEVDRVIVYWRDTATQTNRVFVGIFSGTRPAPYSEKVNRVPDPNKARYYIKFSSLIEVGITLSNWIEFGNGSQSPVCYC